MSEQNEVKPKMKQQTLNDVPIGIDLGESPVEDLAAEISASDLARKWAGKD